MNVEHRLVVELELQVLGCPNLSSMLARIEIFPTMWQRMSGLHLLIRPSVCKTLL